MTDQSPNDQFHASSFMQGANAAYLEQLYAQYAQNPDAVDEGAGAGFFAGTLAILRTMGRCRGAGGAVPVSRTDWRPQPEDDWTNALTGEWPAAPRRRSKGSGPQDQGTRRREKGRPPQTTRRSSAPCSTRSGRLMLIPRLPDPGGTSLPDLDPLGIARPGPRSPELDPKS